MYLTRTAIEKTRITGTLVVLIMLAGYLAFLSMPRSQDPGFTVRTAMISAYFPGASPERVEKLVTDPLEKAIQEMPELDFVTSTSKTGVSIIYVEIKQTYKEVRPIWDSLRRKVQREAPSLPQGVIGPFVNDEFGDVFGIMVSILGDGYSYAELKLVADQARDAMLLLENVAKVDIVGAQEERVFLDFNNGRLAELGISPYQLRQVLSTQNIVIPGGSLHVDDERIFLEPTGNFEGLGDIEDTIIALPGRPEVITLKDLVTVSRGYNDPPSRRMYANGYTALSLAMSMRSGGNIINMGDEVMACVEKLRSQYPIGIEFEITAFEPEAVAQTIDNFTSNLMQAIVIVSLSMLLFLGLRTGLVVATLIPTTILATFLVMGHFEIGLDKISLAALIISLGMLVDNAIVMSESIMVMMGQGVSGKDAAITSAKELNIPLLTSSLTTAAAFLPIYLAESNTGEYTASLFQVVTISLICSWLLSLTLIPLLCAKFLKPEQVEDGQAYQSRFYRTYRGALMLGLRRPFLTLLLVLAVFLISLKGFDYIPTAFFPESDQPMFTAEVELPTGTAIEETDRVVRQIDAYIDAELRAGEGKPGITNWTSYVGEGAPRFYLSYAPQPPTPEYGFFLFNVTDYKLSHEWIKKLKTWVESNFPDAVLSGALLPNGPPVSDPIAVRISGRDSAVLFKLVAELKEKLSSIPGTLNVDDNWGFLNKKLVIEVNQARARRAGLTSQDIAVSLQTLLSGLEISQYREGDKTIPIILRSSATDREDLGNLEQLRVYSQSTGGSAPLLQIADVKVVWEAPKILRRDRLRSVTVSSKLVEGVGPTQVENQFVPWLKEQSAKWPPGYRFEMGGENEESQKSQKSISDKLPIAGMIIILLLVGQFNSMRRASIILSTLPLAVIGVVIGMLITQAPLGFMAFLGIISLFGIVINNAIVLIDRIDYEIRELGSSPQKAVLEAGQRRLRPILLTTITTLAGLIPLWTGGGPMFEPMAVALIFGLAFSTVLTLGVIPVLYCIFFKVSFKDVPPH